MRTKALEVCAGQTETAGQCAARGPLCVVAVLFRRFGVGGDRRLHAGRGLHRQSVLLLFGPGRALQLNQFVTQFDCHGVGSYWDSPIVTRRHTVLP